MNKHAWFWNLISTWLAPFTFRGGETFRSLLVARYFLLVASQRTRPCFQTAPANIVMWNLQIEILYILGHTDNEKDRLHSFSEFGSIMKQIPKMSGILRGNCCETCRNIPRKTPTNVVSKKNSLTRQMLFREACSNVL